MWRNEEVVPIIVNDTSRLLVSQDAHDCAGVGVTWSEYSTPNPAPVVWPFPETENCYLPQLGYTLNPDENYTLEELLELDLEPYQAQIDKVCVTASELNVLFLGEELSIVPRLLCCGMCRSTKNVIEALLKQPA